MPNYLVLEWGRGGIRGLDAAVTGGAVTGGSGTGGAVTGGAGTGNMIRVRASFSQDWPAELDAVNDAEGVGLWLKSRVAELGTGERRLIVLVSREDIVMRLLALPEAKDDTVADLVRFQTGARSSVPLDQLALDYLPLVAAPPHGGRWVQTATVPARLLRHIRTCAEVAGLDLCTVGTTTVALGEAIARAARSRDLSMDCNTLIICVVAGQLDVALWRGTDLLFSHGARAEDSNAVTVEVQRALMSHQGVVGEGGVGRAWLIAPADSEMELRAALASRLGCEVITFDRSQDLPASLQATGLAADAGPSIAALGALRAGDQAMVPRIDFLQPRRRIVKRDRTKIIAAVCVGLLFCVLATAYLGSRLYVNTIEQRIAEQTKLVQARDETLRQGEPTREAIALLSAWESRRVDWLEQMQRIGGEMPGTEHVYLNRWRFDRATGTALGTTEAMGFARQRQDAEQLTQRLAEQPGFRIRPNSMGTGGGDPEYPILFQLNAELVTPARQPARKESE